MFSEDEMSGMTRRGFMAGLAAAGAGGAWGLVRTLEAHAARTPAAGHAVCLFSKHLQWLDYDAMAETAAEIGFDGVDLTVRPGGHVLPERAEEDLPRAVEAVRGAGLDVPLMTTAITDPRDPHAEPILRTAHALGIAAYRMGYLDYEDGRSLVDTLEDYRPRLRDLAALNAEYEIHGAYQNHDGTRVGSPLWDLWYLLRDLDPRWIGCQYDVRHATVEGGNTWRLSLELLRPYIRTLVAKDFKWAQRDGGRWRVQDVPLGEGMVDFDAFFALVERYGIAGPISVHFEYPVAEDEGLALTARRREAVAVMRADVQRLRAMLAEAGL
jgi:sugar phosphate isomerase/epimerase